MDPILRVIFYLFNKNNVEVDTKVDTVKSFFEKGIFFPKFVSLAFKINEIPKINHSPHTYDEKMENNELTLRFLVKKFPQISKTKLSFQTEADQKNILKLILIKKCYPYSEQDILHRCNNVVDHLGIQFTRINELINWKSLILLLKVLSKENFQEEKVEINNNNISYAFVQKFFKLCKAPLIIDEKSLELENRYLFLIQLIVLIDFYIEKHIDQISIESESSSNSDDSNYSDDITDTYYETGNLTEEERKKNLFPKNYNEIENNEEQEEQEETKSSVVSEILSKIKIDEIEVNDYDTYSPNNSSDEDNNSNDTDFSKGEKLQTEKLIHKRKKKPTNFITFQKMEKEILLKTINELATALNMNKYFYSIHDTIEDDWIPKFVMHFFNIKNIKNVYLNNAKLYSNMKKLSVIERENINSVIEYLKEKEPKFDVLLLNFKNPDLYDSSAILFYTMFLNFFFLKQSRKKLFERCITILFPTNKEGKKEMNILTNWSTYVELTYFVVYGKKMAKHLSYKENELFEKNGIPKIIDKNILNLVHQYNKIPDVIYYQLQFIFDALDSKYSQSRIIECFLLALSKLNKIQYPRIDFITSSIRAKNISLILQIRQRKKLEMKKQKSNKDQNKIEAKKDHEYQSDECEVENKIETKREDKSQIPMKYLDRFASCSTEKQEKKEKHQIKHLNIVNMYEYWNSPNSNYIYKNGILINNSLNKNEQADSFFDEISTIFQLYEKNEINKKRIKSPKKVQLFDDPLLRNKSPYKLYKIFTYDEQVKKWILNYEDLNKIGLSLQMSFDTLKTPLILFMNSSEQELISMNSNLINCLYPHLEDEDNNIFVYALCDRFLSQLNYVIDKKNKNKSKIKPIFLLLHVPKKKEMISDIQSIITTIYSYLSNICDAEVVILDEQNYRSQIEMIEIINKINYLYEMKVIKDKFKPTPTPKQTNESIEIGQEEYFNDKIIDLDEDYIESSDSNSSESECFEYENEDRLIITQKSNQKHKTILLINETNHEFDSSIDSYLNQSVFFKSIKSEIKSIHFINTSKTITYKSFLDKLNEFSEESQTTFEEIKEKIEINEIINLCTTYISSKTNKNWKEKLEEMINERYLILNNDKTDQNSISSTVFSQLQNEISKISLPFDSEFLEECKYVISKIKNKTNQKNREILKSELETSSKIKMKTLNQYENYEFESTEKVEDIKNEHVDFIKEEFTDIIKTLIGTKESNIFYEENIDVLKERIEKDIEEINQFIHIKETEFNQQYIINENKKEEEIDIRSNYSIREAENVREIKVQIKTGEDLKNEIEQDF